MSDSLNEEIALKIFGGPEKNPQWYWWRGSNPPLDIEGTIYTGPKFSEEIGAAWEIITIVKTWLFSKRLIFKRQLQRIISDRMGMCYGDLLGGEEIILFVKPEDICLAALRAHDGWPVEIGR